MHKTRSKVSIVSVLSAAAILFCFASGSFGAGEPLIGDVTASANYDSWGGKCPKLFVFTGQITANAKGSLNYHWERSDGAKGPSKAVHVKPGQTLKVHDSWKLGESGTKMTISETLVVGSGNQHLRVKSQDIAIECK